MKRIVLLLVLTGLFITATAAQISESDVPADPSVYQLQQYAQIYNNNTDKVPGFVRGIVGDQTINLHYENNTYGVEMNNMQIDNVTTSYNESSLEVWVDQKDIVEVANANNSVKKLRTKLDNDEITYKEHGVANKVKFGVIRAAQKLGLF